MKKINKINKKLQNLVISKLGGKINIRSSYFSLQNGKILEKEIPECEYNILLNESHSIEWLGKWTRNNSEPEDGWFRNIFDHGEIHDIQSCIEFINIYDYIFI